jgi:pimeloyl-ACP methyl ester carboxylesterase
MQRRYGTIRQPALVLWGREDRIATLGFGERLARDLPHARLVVIPRCGHMPMREALDATIAALGEFLRAGGDA